MPLSPILRGLIRTCPTIAPVPNRALISVTGSQAAEFLNGLTAATVPKHPKSHFYTAFLHAQGRVIHDIFVWAHTTSKGHSGYLVEYDASPSNAPPLLPLLKRYVLRSKVKIRDVSEEYDVWQAWGSEEVSQWETLRRWDFARSGVIEPVWDKNADSPWGSTEGVLRDRRAVGMGHRLLVRKGDKPKEMVDHDVDNAEAYLLHRILHGIPEGSTDIPPMQAFPMDSNLDVMGGLDFRKGCYVGQELTVRTYHTGQLRKRILPVSVYVSNSDDFSGPPEPFFLTEGKLLPPGLEIRPHLRQIGDEHTPHLRLRGTGKLLSSYEGAGLALLRLEQVDAVEQGKAFFTLDSSHGQDYKVVPYWPDSWPQRPPEERE